MTKAPTVVFGEHDRLMLQQWYIFRITEALSVVHVGGFNSSVSVC